MATLKSKVTQFMLAQGQCVQSEDLFKFLGTLREAGSSQLDENNVGRSLANINLKLQESSMMIRPTYDQKTRKTFYSLIQIVDNEITKKASHHTDREFEYFRLIYEAVKDGGCDLQSVLRIGKDLKLLNYKRLIADWQDKHWLRMDGDAVYAGPRANAELDVLRTVSRSDDSQPHASTSTQHRSSTSSQHRSSTSSQHRSSTSSQHRSSTSSQHRPSTSRLAQ